MITYCLVETDELAHMTKDGQKSMCSQAVREPTTLGKAVVREGRQRCNHCVKIWAPQCTAGALNGRYVECPH